jgi:hypothetical protein
MHEPHAWYARLLRFAFPAGFAVFSSVSLLLLRCPSDAERQFHTLAELTENGLEKENKNTAVNLMHGVAHVHQVNAKCRINQNALKNKCSPAFLR